MVAKAGYWRMVAPHTTLNLTWTAVYDRSPFVKCINEHACEGASLGIDRSQDKNESCAIGYQGRLCHSCQLHYARTTGDSCSKCASPDMVRLGATGGFALIGVINGVFLQETMKAASTDDDLMVRRKKQQATLHQ